MTEIIASPSTRRMARDQQVDIDDLAKKLGRTTIGPEDISATPPAASGGDTSYWDVDHSQYGPVTIEPMSRFAQVAARNMAAAPALIPAVTHHDRADIRAIEGLRASLKTQAQARGVKLTALAFHVAALARALRAFPRFNASLSPDGQTLTITNLGGIGGSAFTPIVNPPEVAILGITRTETVTIWDGNTPHPVPMVPLDLSYDHRVINGADAARFMAHHCSLIADPRHMLI